MNIELGKQSDIDIINRCIRLQDKVIADIGCGDGSFAATLAQNGARVSGIEPDPNQARINRHAAPVRHLELFEASAENLPFEDNSQDLLVFRFSLHHIPGTLHARVFEEAARVLKMQAKLLIIEPLASGSANYVMELFHDEAKVREEAQVALRTLAPSHFRHDLSFSYQIIHSYTSFSAYCSHYANKSYNSYQLELIKSQGVKDRFAEYLRANGSAELTQPIKADLFIK